MQKISKDFTFPARDWSSAEGAGMLRETTARSLVRQFGGASSSTGFEQVEDGVGRCFEAEDGGGGISEDDKEEYDAGEGERQQQP